MPLLAVFIAADSATPPFSASPPPPSETAESRKPSPCSGEGAERVRASSNEGEREEDKIGASTPGETAVGEGTRTVCKLDTTEGDEQPTEGKTSEGDAGAFPSPACCRSPP